MKQSIRLLHSAKYLQSLLIISYFLFSCHNAESDPEILGGQYILPDGGAWDGPIVALVKESNLSDGKTFCSGTLIAADLVLTAAHCFLETHTADIRIVFGTNVRLTSADRIRKASRVLTHEDFNAQAALQNFPGQAPNDIALLKLDGDAPAGVRTIAPEIDRGQNFIDLHIAGFGLQDLNNKNSSGHLKFVPATLFLAETVRKTIRLRGNDPAVSNAGALPGDSGGPALARFDGEWKVIGVDSTGGMSWGGFTGENTYTDVRHYEAWIKDASVRIHDDTAPIFDTPPQIALYAFRNNSDSNSLGFTLTNNGNAPLSCSISAKLIWEWEQESLILAHGHQTMGVEKLHEVLIGVRDRAETNPSYVVINAKRSGTQPRLDSNTAKYIDAKIQCNGYHVLRRQSEIRWSN